jgi:cell division protein FtsB
MTLADRLRAVDPATRARVFRWTVRVIAASLLFNLVFGDMGVLEGLRQRRAAARLRSDVAALQEENNRLSADIRALNSDPFRIESIAREDLGLARPGEIIFVFPPSARPADDPAPVLATGRR